MAYLFLLFLFLIPTSSEQAPSPPSHPTPKPWPLQFHSRTYANYSGALSLIDIWYDFPNGRNFNIIQSQLGELLYDLEWTNGTSFYYTLDSAKKCSTYHFDVGILRPDWLDGANYLGQKRVDGFLCNAWEKVDFITYYEDVDTKMPVGWVFYTGRAIHVMTFDVGAVLEDSKWQAPVYCFGEENENSNSNLEHSGDRATEGRLLERESLIVMRTSQTRDDRRFVLQFFLPKKQENNTL